MCNESVFAQARHDNNQTYFAAFTLATLLSAALGKALRDKQSEEDDPDRCEGRHAGMVAWRGG
jgi:hypothetical protein